jgi:octaheme c-type cytochrome (tetrathionate reductase family)
MNTPSRYLWLIALPLTLAVIVVPIALVWPRPAPSVAAAWDFVPAASLHSDHTDILNEPFASGPAVTQRCLECHADAAQQVMATTHWTWESEPVQLPGRAEPVTIGKKNQLNNFCIGIQGNWNKCTSCHAGYGWSDASYDFDNASNVDCLACHADPAFYAKADFGNPAEGVDLTAAAQSVRAPTRENCGQCHFNGGGGNGVKHGDLDESLYFPDEHLDVHMGALDFQCTACHRTQQHQSAGSATSVTVGADNLVRCTDCHADQAHADERLNAHTGTVACQTCHIPAMALEDPTKVAWDWSTAGQDRPDDHLTYLKIKGSFIYERDFRPVYLWDNGTLAQRYLLGDQIDPAQPTLINQPGGDISDPAARIAPFKLHVARQPYDVVYNYLLQPVTAGEGGFWATFDWDSALAMAEPFTGLRYSGEYDFTETWMYWRTSHMVQPAENALQCTACHGDEGRLDWLALGYPGDPLEWGGRQLDR